MKIKNIEKISIYAIILSGIFGAYFSNLINVAKLHYIPIFLGLFYFYYYINFKYKILVVALTGVIFTTSETNYGFLSSAQAYVIPVILLAYPSVKTISSIKSALLFSLLIIFIGIFFEFCGILSFKVNGYLIQEVVHERYAGFAGSPLAAAYVAALSILGLRNFKSSFKFLIMLIILFILYMARTRGAYVAGILSIFMLYFLVNNQSKSLYTRGLASIFGLSFTLFLLDILLYGTLFDWQLDQGNTGRIRQWSYCAGQFFNNPIAGIGAGNLSPISESYLDSIYIDENSGLVRSCESTYLKILAEYGVLIGGPYLILSFLIFFKAIKFFRTLVLTKKFNDSDICAVFYIIFIWLLQIFNQTLDSPWMSLIYFLSIKHIFLKFTALKNLRHASYLSAISFKGIR